MRKFRTAVLTGIAALAVTGVGVAAARDMHMMRDDLPDGSVARIEYQGNVASKVSIAPALHFVPVGYLDPVDAAPFRALDRVAAEMDRQAKTLFQQVDALPSLVPFDQTKLDLAAFSKLPAGTIHYSFISESNGGGTCSRSIQVTSLGSGGKPKMVSTSSGDCKPADKTPTPARLDPPARAAVPGVTATGAKVTAGSLRAHAAA